MSEILEQLEEKLKEQYKSQKEIARKTLALNRSYEHSKRELDTQHDILQSSIIDLQQEIQKLKKPEFKVGNIVYGVSESVIQKLRILGVEDTFVHCEGIGLHHAMSVNLWDKANLFHDLKSAVESGILK